MLQVPVPMAKPDDRQNERAPATLETAYRQYAQAVFRFAFRCVGRRDLAEDLASEAFLALHRNADAIDFSQLPSWLFKVVKNRAIDYWRRQETERRYAMEAGGPEPQEGAPEEEVLALLDSGVLKPVHRVCVVLRYVHGMTRAEIAQRTGLTDTQVKGHLQYALELLRRALQEERDEAR